MIPRPEALDGTMFDTVRFKFVRKPIEHMHEIKYPVVSSTLTVLVDAMDRIQAADLRFCKNRHVWIDAHDAVSERRAGVLWVRLLDFENEPAMLFLSNTFGLTTYQPSTRMKKEFSHEQTR